MKYLILVIQSKKTDYNTKLIEIKNKITDQDHDKCTTNQCTTNKLTYENFTARLKKAKLVSKSDIANFVK